MKPWTTSTWLRGLGLSGALAFALTGCGGGDVPDPGSDELAAVDDAGDPTAEPQAPPPIEAPAPPPGGEATPPPAAEAAAEPAAAPTPDAPPAAGDATAAAPADAQNAATDAPTAKSETAELLASATGAAAPDSSVADSAAAPGGGPGAPGLSGSEGMLGDPALDPDAGRLAYPGGNPAGLNGPGSEADARNPYAPGGETGDSTGLGGFAGGSGGASELKPGDTNTPHGAVDAFLYALQHKDRDRLAEATALRANTVEEGGKYIELFSRIIDTSISDSELDDLSSKLEGFRVSGQNQVKSTGRLGVTIRKTSDKGGWLQRTVTVRKEKKGWGVLDISGPTEFKGTPGRGNTNQRR